MRLFRKITHVCQNCRFGNNDKGKWKKTLFYHTGIIDDNGKKDKRHWHIFCEKKQKYYPWDKFKRCFKEEKKEGIVVICITVKENGDIVFEFNKKGFKAFRKAGIVEVHPKEDTGNPSFSIKNWNTKKRRRKSITIAIKDEKNNINKIELNKKLIEKKWKQEDKEIFKKR